MRAFVAFNETGCRACNERHENFLGVFSSLEEAQNCPECTDVKEMQGTEEVRSWFLYRNSEWIGG